MSVDRLPGLPLPPSGAVQPGRDREGLEQLKASELAREFESMLILQMLRQMRQSALDESSEDDGLSSSTMLDTVDAELARQLSKDGGLGLADVMMKAIRGQIGEGAAAAAAPDGTGIPAGFPALAPGAAAVVPGTAGPPSVLADEHDAAHGIEGTKLTSSYGWRTDPFTGAPRYHQGIDFKAAYGQGVPAAGDGLIVEAGERGAYGLTVVVEHGNGVRTRYAHLSALDVKAGDQVLQGQEIGRVGQSGRATGPHLHFEVIRNGQRIDPATAVALQGSGLGGLKLAGAAADFPIGGRVHAPAMTGADDED